MTGRHEGPPLGSAAREATAAPWHGKHRRVSDLIERLDAAYIRAGLLAAEEIYEADGGDTMHDEPDEPPRCWSCGHTTDMFCECSCCNDDDDPDGEWNPNA